MTAGAFGGTTELSGPVQLGLERGPTSTLSLRHVNGVTVGFPDEKMRAQAEIRYDSDVVGLDCA